MYKIIFIIAIYHKILNDIMLCFIYIYIMKILDEFLVGGTCRKLF